MHLNSIRTLVAWIFVCEFLGAICLPTANLVADEDTVVHLRDSDVSAMLRVDEIQSIEAEAYNIPQLYGPEEDIARFTIPAKSHESILALMKAPKVDTVPSLVLGEIATVRLKYKDGFIRTIICYWKGGKGPLRFSVNGVRCVAERDRLDIDAALTLVARLRRIREDVDKMK